MELNDIVRTRRAVRAYLPDLVPESALKRIFENTHLAPSANNAQPWHFCVVGNQALKLQIVKLTFGHAFLGKAPLVIICCGKSYPSPYSWLGDKMYLVDCAIAMDHFALAARNEGLGTCWIGDFDQEALKKLIKIPRGYDVIMLTPLGRPANPNAFRETRARRSLEGMVTELR